MAAKTTIALVGIANEECNGLINSLAKADFRLLLVINNESDLQQFSNPVISYGPDAEVEVINCVKNGCWEADIIVLFGADNFGKELVAKIKEVSTQKIVVALSINKDNASFFPFEAKNIQLLLPYSKVVQLVNRPESADAFIAGDDEEAVQTVASIAKVAGFHPIIVDSLLTNREG